MQLCTQAMEEGWRIAFVHIPKTGGNTFREYLRRQFSPCRDLILNNSESIAQFRTLPADAKATYHLVSGHFPFGFDPQLPRRFRYFTFLRHPVSRVISNYNYMMGGEPQNAVAQRLRAENWSLRDFVTTEDPDVLPRLFAQLVFLGHPGSAPGPVTLNDMMQRAITNVVSEFEFVGCLDRYDESLVYLHERYGFELTPYKKENTTRARDKRPVSAEDRALLEARMEPELRVYEVARRVLDARLATVQRLADKVGSVRPAA